MAASGVILAIGSFGIFGVLFLFMLILTPMLPVSGWLGQYSIILRAFTTVLACMFVYVALKRATRIGDRSAYWKPGTSLSTRWLAFIIDAAKVLTLLICIMCLLSLHVSALMIDASKVSIGFVPFIHEAGFFDVYLYFLDHSFKGAFGDILEAYDLSLGSSIDVAPREYPIFTAVIIVYRTFIELTLIGYFLFVSVKFWRSFQN